MITCSMKAKVYCGANQCQNGKSYELYIQYLYSDSNVHINCWLLITSFFLIFNVLLC